MKKITLFIVFFTSIGFIIAQEKGNPFNQVYSIRNKLEIISLNGTWDFKYIPNEVLQNSEQNFYLPTFNISSWDKITVPGNWETNGKNPPKYGRLVDPGRGLYRTNFRIPDTWSGKHVFIRFDGVLYGYKLYVNGNFVGEWNSAFNPCQFDLTNYISRDKPNVLAVDVTTRSKGWEFDTNDCWGLSGIFRDVELFSVPSLHFKDITFRSYLKGEDEALLNINIDISSFNNKISPGSKVQVTLFDQAMRNICSFSEMIVNIKQNFIFERKVKNANYWTSETPYLYNLTAKILNKDGSVVQQINEKVGIREITIVDGVFLVNKKPVLLRGVCSNEINLKLGRALSDFERLQDLSLMKAANINFIRTSHYPHHPRFLEICDEMGFYVDCEVPFGFGDEHLKDSTYQIELLKRADATLTRDKNHPSVIFWTIGNENKYTELVEKTAQYVKAKDPTRPRTIPVTRGGFMQDWQTYSDNIDLYCFHYPKPEVLDSLAQILKKPIILTEYSHSLGLAFENMEAIYNVILKYKNIAGGNVWLWADQGIFSTRTKEAFLNDTIIYGVWKDSVTYYDSFGDQGTDGIVYADRYPSEDYWYVRKVYSPFVVKNKEIRVTPGMQNIILDIENRFDFIPLNGYAIRWNLKSYKDILASGEAISGLAAQSKGTLTLKINIPDGVENEYLLELVCFSPSGNQIYEKTITLNIAEKRTLLSRMQNQSSQKQIIRKKNGQIIVSMKNNQFCLTKNGKVIIEGESKGSILDGYPILRVGRKPTINVVNQGIRRKGVFYWNPYLLKPDFVSSSVRQTEHAVTVDVIYRWNRIEKSGEYISGTVSYVISDNGLLKVSYNLKPYNGTGSFLEFGLGFELPVGFDVFKWLGEGPFASTPGKTAFNERDIWALHKDDLRFMGNRSQVDIALFTEQNGIGGLGFIGDNNRLGIENVDNNIVFTDNQLVTGYATKINYPGSEETPVNKVEEIKGEFYLIPVKKSSPVFDTVFDFNETIVPEIPFAKSYGF